jgi:hypothetical protein
VATRSANALAARIKNAGFPVLKDLVSRSAENWFFRTFSETTEGPCVSRFPSSDFLPLARRAGS